MGITKQGLLAVAVLLFSTAVFAADEYKIDKVHSNVGFSVKHMVISSVPGRFTDFDGTINYDEKDVTKSSVKVTIQAASINTDSANRDSDLRGPNFLDTSKYPTITFESKQIKKTSDGLVALGTLTIKDVSKEIELPFTINGKIRMGQSERMAAEAHIKINRQEYHLSFNRMIEAGPVVGDEVNINLTVEATHPLAKPAADSRIGVRPVKVVLTKPAQKQEPPQNQDIPLQRFRVP